MKVIEFLGMSRAGKSTQQKIVSKILQKRGYSCATFTRPNISFRQAGSLENFHKLFFNYMKRAYIRAGDKTDYFIFDRGFYDRIGMLTKDVVSRGVAVSFADELGSELEEYARTVNHPIMFVVSPEVSYARWEQQKAEGMDNSHLSEGLEQEDLKMLGREHALYLDLRKQHPHIPLLNTESSKPTVTAGLLKLIEIAKDINERSRGVPCMR